MLRGVCRALHRIQDLADLDRYVLDGLVPVVWILPQASTNHALQIWRCRRIEFGYWLGLRMEDLVHRIHRRVAREGLPPSGRRLVQQTAESEYVRSLVEPRRPAS